MKRNLLFTFILVILAIGITNAQTIVWSSDCEDLSGWAWDDIDGDGQNWFYYTGGTNIGFQPGQFLASPSMSASPDNAIQTPSFTIPGNAESISIDFRIAASSNTSYLETYGVYIQEVGVGGPYDDLIHQATLNDGGDNSASMVNVSIPSSYAGKTVIISFRHFNTTNQEFLMVDDISVESQESLSIENSNFDNFSFYPNPVNTILNFNTQKQISQVQIFNILGQNVMNLHGSNLMDNKINVADLSNGNY
ncbi:MAG: choice-of-anchor J domain-containing protein, partial [Bacteroidia bacterium]|nr:choice-of-anchor J domain-containing protein [Bacteroidia bacterium]